MLPLCLQRGTSSYPSIVQAKTIEVEVPLGNTTNRTIIPNPLYTYTFHPIPIEDFRDAQLLERTEESPSLLKANPWILWKSTKRWPTNKTEEAESQDTVVGYDLDKNARNTRERIYQLLSMQTDYQSMSNNLAASKDQAHNSIPDSLESIHDTLHNAIGNQGHMWAIPFPRLIRYFGCCMRK